MQLRTLFLLVLVAVSLLISQGGVEAAPNKMVLALMCRLDCPRSYDPVCAVSDNGVPRTFDNVCLAKITYCYDRTYYNVVKQGEC
ncbi:hypothetical protein LSTR_LSTR002903 [Laodelphax striatellus]|uniref:Kazal-like domain-containing protein n=1 Tax=Laodelphax striatellus TaxID=195883 RepID=A0A482XMW6_LAOST|nr:hypothetical protein LSTR_LSTR002903 [Laodelphax striatellus]